VERGAELRTFCKARREFSKDPYLKIMTQAKNETEKETVPVL
jgi:hypothetical protein